jgi:hypothetical protein
MDSPREARPIHPNRTDTPYGGCRSFGPLGFMKSKSQAWQEYCEQFTLQRAQFIQSLTQEDKIDLANEWSQAILKTDSESKHWTQTDSNAQKCLSDPNTGLEIIKLIWDRVKNQCDLSFLGVLVEDYLSMHGGDVIKHIEKLALEEQQFKQVLHFVYRNTMPGSVYEKVRHAAASKDDDKNA